MNDNPINEEDYVLETELCALWSVDRKVISGLRKKIEWRDFWKKTSPGGCIVWEKSKLPELSRALNIPVNGSGEGNSLTGTNSEIESVLRESDTFQARVVKIHKLNTKLIDCIIFPESKMDTKETDPEKAEIISVQPQRVRVRDNRLFHVGMELRHVRKDNGIYAYYGKLPRWQGDKVFTQKNQYHGHGNK